MKAQRQVVKLFKEKKKLNNYAIAFTMKPNLLSIVFKTIYNMLSVYICSLISHITSLCKPQSNPVFLKGR